MSCRVTITTSFDEAAFDADEDGYVSPMEKLEESFDEDPKGLLPDLSLTKSPTEEDTEAYFDCDAATAEAQVRAALAAYGIDFTAIEVES